MKKIRYYVWAGLMMAVTCVFAQAPSAYYAATKGKKGAALKTALNAIVHDHVVRSYSQLWEDFHQTDVRSDGKIWDMYSSTTSYEPGGSAQGANYKTEGDSYNREHSFPKSWFNDAKPMYTDLFHLYPTDGYVNNRRSNYPYGETDGETYQSAGGFSKVGKCTLAGYSGTVFEPNDEYKGDLARSYFYMATAYEEEIASWSSPMLAGNAYPAFEEWALTMLLRWSAEDPVSQKEIERNNAVYGIQQNRNPFIDFPGLEQWVWGKKTSQAFDPDNYGGSSGSDEGVTPEVPVFSVASGQVERGTVVTVTAPTAGSSICYAINGGNYVQAASPVSVTVNSSLSIEAYAVLNYVESAHTTASYTLSGEPQPGNGVYVQVRSADELEADVRYIIMAPSHSVALSSHLNDKQTARAAVSVTPEDSKITTETGSTGLPYALFLGGQSGAWTFYDAVNGCYLSLTSNNNNLTPSADVESPNAQWTIEVDEGTAAAEISPLAYPERTIQYNPSNPRFACYSSSQKGVSLFKEQPLSTGIDWLSHPEATPQPVYDVTGRPTGHTVRTADELHRLPAGLYVVGGRKVYVK